ncbi:SpoIIE family protein phosphatase [Streptomyces broussonetiae]|uniref:SpoIIE family protein phosphatase n=1 Tax=Streptomyces broussonetiae TaxID=2686304 RepID=UPI001E38E358|nr:SpoIIE family protein phosphatase [Streptomyces broussonetiae]
MSPADFEARTRPGNALPPLCCWRSPTRPHIRLTSCGHPPSLLLRPGEAITVLLHPAPPLGAGSTGPQDYTLDVFSFEVGDILLLYADGVIEARDPVGGFYLHGTGSSVDRRRPRDASASHPARSSRPGWRTPRRCTALLG